MLVLVAINRHPNYAKIMQVASLPKPTINLRTTLIIIAAFIFQTTFAQFKYGTYKITGDAKDFGGGTLFSELIIKQNKTFTYKYLTSTSCFLWYDSYGKWETNKDTLTLIDTVISHHPVVNFTKYKETNDNKISISIRTNQSRPIQGIKVLYIFKDSKDTLFGITNSEGKFVIETKNRLAIKKERKYRSVDDLEIWVVYFRKNGQEQTTNIFSDLSADIECVIDDNAKNEAAIRTTTYKIQNSNLIYLNQLYDKEDVRPGRYLFGSFKFDKE
jgi:hypothetical protein